MILLLACTHTTPHPNHPPTTKTPNLTWKTIPAGTSIIGGTNDRTDAQPIWYAKLASFEMLATEVTHAQYQAHTPPKPRDNDCNTGDCPVRGVTWFEARKYCQTIGGDLPTEVEWEYAARAGTTTPYWWGENPDEAIQHIWYLGNAEYSPRPVGAPGHDNPWGISDMIGNAREWTLDEYQEDTYTQYAGSTPENPINIGGIGTGTPRIRTEDVDPKSWRVVRGGSAGIPAELLHVYVRDWFFAGDNSRPRGFRCVRPPT